MTWSASDEVGTWLSPRQYVDRLNRIDPEQQISVSTLMDWLRDGRHPGINLAGRWYITPGCLVELHRRQLAADDTPGPVGEIPGHGGFGHIGKKKSPNRVA